MIITKKNLIKLVSQRKKKLLLKKRLDDVVLSKPLENNALIKVDVQGFEDEVINGGEDTFQNSKIVILESSFTPLYKREKTFDFHYKRMIDLGFEYHGVFFDQVKSKINGKPLYSDLIFINKNI